MSPALVDGWVALVCLGKWPHLTYGSRDARQSNDLVGLLMAKWQSAPVARMPITSTLSHFLNLTAVHAPPMSDCALPLIPDEFLCYFEILYFVFLYSSSPSGQNGKMLVNSTVN